MASRSEVRAEVRDAIEDFHKAMNQKHSRTGQYTNEMWVHQNPARAGTDMRGYIVSTYEKDREDHAATQAMLSGLVGAINALKGGEPFDEAKLLQGVSEVAHEAAARGVADAIKSIDTTVTFERDEEGN